MFSECSTEGVVVPPNPMVDMLVLYSWLYHIISCVLLPGVSGMLSLLGKSQSNEIIRSSDGFRDVSESVSAGWLVCGWAAIVRRGNLTDFESY